MDKIDERCNNNYTTKEEFELHYAESEQELRKCKDCPYMDFDNGIMVCLKFM